MAMDEVELTLPGVLFGGDPRGFLEFLGLLGRPLGDNRWVVRPSHDKVFFSHYGLSDDTVFVDRFDHLTQMPMAVDSLDDPETAARFAEHEKLIAERLAGGPDIAAVFHSVQMEHPQMRNA